MEIFRTDELDQYSKEECVRQQEYLAKQVEQRDVISPDKLQLIAGVDLAYWKSSAEQAVCCIVVVDRKTKMIVEAVHAEGEVKFPYIPGCLAFRELPLVLQAVSKLNVHPDIFLFDGNGVLHPRRMGLATHASFYLNTPTVGVAKSYYKVANAFFEMPENNAGSISDIIADKEVLGRAVRTTDYVRPVFVSVGNKISLDTATSLVLELVGKEGHIPIPTRYADLETHRVRAMLQGKEK